MVEVNKLDMARMQYMHACRLEGQEMMHVCKLCCFHSLNCTRNHVMLCHVML